MTKLKEKYKIVIQKQQIKIIKLFFDVYTYVYQD